MYMSRIYNSTEMYQKVLCIVNSRHRGKGGGGGGGG